MILGTIVRIAGWAIGGIQAAVELVGAGKRLARQVKKAAASPDETDPIPLTHRDVERIAEFGRRAGHESEASAKAPSRR